MKSSKTSFPNICLTLIVAAIIAAVMAAIFDNTPILPRDSFLRGLVFFGIIIFARLITKRLLYHDGRVRIKNNR